MTLFLSNDSGPIRAEPHDRLGMDGGSVGGGWADPHINTDTQSRAVTLPSALQEAAPLTNAPIAHGTISGMTAACQQPHIYVRYLFQHTRAYWLIRI